MSRSLPRILAISVLALGTPTSASALASTPSPTVRTSIPVAPSTPTVGTTPASTAPPVSTPSTTVPAPTTPATPTPLPTAAQAHPRTASSHRAGTNNPSPAAVAIAALAALLALVCAVWGFARWRAFEPHWTLSLRHVLDEAGFRASATWAEFADWAKLGR
jgi:hypothetical protein